MDSEHWMALQAIHGAVHGATLDSSTLGLVQDTFPTHTSKWWPITPCTALKRVVISPLPLAHKMELNPFQFKTMLMETKMATPLPETDGVQAVCIFGTLMKEDHAF